MKLIGVARQKGSGKDTFASLLRPKGYCNVKFAGPLKRMLAVLLRDAGCCEEEISDMVDGRLKETPHKVLCNQTPRHAMQTLGTEWRDLIGQDLWSRILESRLRSDPNCNYVISDVRFHHEVDMVHRLGGTVVLRARGPFSSDPHPSEAEIPFLRFDHSFVNTGTIQDLELFANGIAMRLENKR